MSMDKLFDNSDAHLLNHVIPLNDLREHDTELSCWCKPTIDEVDESVVIHNSMDERESYEKGRKPQ